MRGLVRKIASAAVALGLSCCIAPTNEEYERGRNEDLEAMRALPVEARAVALRDRVLRDGVVLAHPVWAGLSLDAKDTAFDCHGADFKCLYIVAPMRQELAQDYVALGDALRDRGDVDGAIGAYEDAVHTADAAVLSAAAAARIRAAALRGEEKLWADRREPLRAKAAATVARAEETWARTPDAEALEQKYQALLSESRGVMQRDIEQAGQAAVGALQTALSAAGSLSNLQGAAGAVGMTAKLAAVAAAVQRVGPLLVEGIGGSKLSDLGFATFVRDVAGGVSGAIRGLDAGQLRAFLASEGGKRAMVNVLSSLQMLRRGGSATGARKLMADALAAVSAPAQEALSAGAASSSSIATTPPPPAASSAAPPPSGAPDFAARLKRLDDLHEKKLITDDEYQKQRQRILEGL